MYLSGLKLMTALSCQKVLAHTPDSLKNYTEECNEMLLFKHTNNFNNCFIYLYNMKIKKIKDKFDNLYIIKLKFYLLKFEFYYTT